MSQKQTDSLTRLYSVLLWNRTNFPRSSSLQTGYLCMYVHHTCARSGRCSILVTKRAKELISSYLKTRCWKQEVYYSLPMLTDKIQSWIGNQSSNAQSCHHNTSTGCNNPRMGFPGMFVHRNLCHSGRLSRLVRLDHFLCRCQKLADSSWHSNYLLFHTTRTYTCQHVHVWEQTLLPCLTGCSIWYLRIFYYQLEARIVVDQIVPPL
jgi:hypothetical protein